jgi:hypothetical protein
MPEQLPDDVRVELEQVMRRNGILTSHDAARILGRYPKNRLQEHANALRIAARNWDLGPDGRKLLTRIAADLAGDNDD